MAVLFHVFTTLFSHDTFLRALAVCGLLNIGIFTLTLVGHSSEGFVVMPPQMRFIQLFLSTSVLCTAWSLKTVGSRWILPKFEASTQRWWFFKHYDSILPKQVFPSLWTAGCFLFYFIPMATVSCLMYPGLFSSSGQYASLLSRLNHLMNERKTESLTVFGSAQRGPTGTMYGGVTGIRICGYP
jgi:hypothetical protein